MLGSVKNDTVAIVRGRTVEFLSWQGNYLANSETIKALDSESDQPRKKTKYELTDPDVRLMLEVRDGNAAAYEQLVEKYQARLIAVLENMVNRAQAEDLAQEVFMRIYRARKTYTPGAKFSTWLYTITHNVASNAIRKLSRRKEYNLNTSASGQVLTRPLENMIKEDSRMMPARKLDSNERAEIVQLAIRNLNERQRMAILLSKYEGLSYNEIATAMDLTTQAVKSLLSRARGNLKEMLEPYIEQGEKPKNR